MPTCPSCASAHTVKNDPIHNGKQRFKCHDCGRQFMEQPTKKGDPQKKRLEKKQAKPSTLSDSTIP